MHLILIIFLIVPSVFNLCYAESVTTKNLKDTFSKAKNPPNVIVILADDMGYGDMSNNGHPSIRTPFLDRMASGGQKWSNFYVAASNCSASRAGLLTGRLPIRSGMTSSKHRVFFPWSTGGLPTNEFTLAELFKSKNYKTAIIGKWHLGHKPEFLPMRHGFDYWYGIPYSNDMEKDKESQKIVKQSKLNKTHPADFWYNPNSKHFNVPLMENDRVIKRAPDQARLTHDYTERSLAFIRKQQKNPFFLYLAHSMPHVPLFRSAEFEGQSTAGLYGDVIEEMDASVGKILAELNRLNLLRNTLVVFTSDNGPWLQFKTLGGSAGLLRDGKSTTWEGGVRVPTIFFMPGTIKQGVVHEIGSTLDFMATFASMLGADLPEVQLDSIDLMPLLTAPVLTTDKSTEKKHRNLRDEFYFYLDDRLSAIRKGPFKAHFLTRDYNKKSLDMHDPPLLFNLDTDPSERFNIAANHPEIIQQITALGEQHSATLVGVENQLIRR